MSLLPKKLRLIHSAPDRVRARAILSAARHAEPDELPDLCVALLATGDSEAQEFVIRNAHRLGEGGFSIVSGSNSRLFEAFRRIFTSGHDRHVSNALRIIGDGTRTEDSSLIVSILSDESPLISDQAGDALISLSAQVHWPGQDRPFDRIRWLQMDQVAAVAVESFRSHRNEKALTAAAVALVRPGPALMRLLESQDDTCPSLLRGVAGRCQQVAIPGLLVRWLSVPMLASAAARAIERNGHRDIERNVLSAGHLLRSPTRRRAMRRLARPSQVLPSLQQAIGLPASAQRHMPDLINALNLSQIERVSHLTDCLVLGDAGARLAALRSLDSFDSSQAMTAIEQFCLDQSLPVARAAVAKVIRDRWAPGRNVLSRIRESRDPQLVRRGVRLLAAVGIDEFFQHWLTISAHDRVHIARRLLAQDSEAWMARIRDHLADGLRPARLAALGLVRRLRVASAVQDAIASLMLDSDFHVVSAAALALADEASTTGAKHADLIRAALDHQDDRVAANAVESASRLEPDLAIALIEPKTSSRHNRIRANAILGLLRQGAPDAAGQLHAMLSDPEPLQRVSAIWVATRSRAVDEIRTLRRLAGEDRVPELRTRAAAAARLLDAQAVHRPTERMACS